MKKGTNYIYLIKVFLITLIGILLFGLYLHIVLYGENSLTVLSELRDKKVSLNKEAERLKLENGKMQKELFQLSIQMAYTEEE